MEPHMRTPEQLLRDAEQFEREADMMYDPKHRAELRQLAAETRRQAEKMQTTKRT